MKKSLGVLLALVLAVCLLPVHTQAEEVAACDVSEILGEETFFGIMLGSHHLKNDTGHLECPVDILVMLPNHTNLYSSKADDPGMVIELIYKFDGFSKPISNLFVEEILWQDEGICAPQHWLDYCREKNPVWEAFPMSDLELRSHYRLYHISADAQPAYQDIGNIQFDAVFVMNDELQSRAVMRQFPLEIVITNDATTASADESGISLSTTVGESQSEMASDLSSEANPEHEDNEAISFSDEATIVLTPEPTPEPTPVPVSKVKDKKLRDFKLYLTCLGYLPDGYWAYNAPDEDGKERYGDVEIAAVKQYQRDAGMEEVDGIVDDELYRSISQVVESPNELSIFYNENAVLESVCRDLIALGYLEKQALTDLKQGDGGALAMAVGKFRDDYQLDSSFFVDAELLYTLKDAQPTIAPTNTPVPTPIPLTLDTANESITLVNRQSLTLSGMSPSNSTLLICSADANGQKIVLGSTKSNDEGRWQYELNAQLLDLHFEDKGRMQVFVIPADPDQIVQQSVEYNASASASLVNCQLYRHGDQLTITGYTKPNVVVAAENSISTSDNRGYFEMVLSPFPNTASIPVFLDSDYDHPVSLSMNQVRAKALLGFLQPISEVTELILIILLLLAILLIVLLKRNKSGVLDRKVPSAPQRVNSSVQKGGSKHA